MGCGASSTSTSAPAVDGVQTGSSLLGGGAGPAEQVVRREETKPSKEERDAAKAAKKAEAAAKKEAAKHEAKAAKHAEKAAIVRSGQLGPVVGLGAKAAKYEALAAKYEALAAKSKGGEDAAADEDAAGPAEQGERREETSRLPQHHEAAGQQQKEERRWAADSAAAAVALLHELPLPSSEDAVTPFLKQLWDVFAEYKPAAATVHSKCLDVATEQGEYYGVYSMCVPALKGGKYEYGTRPSLAEPAPAAEGKGFVASTISPAIYGNADWQAREITGGEVAAQPCYQWHGDDCTTGEPYDVRVRPWYRHAVERGAGFTDPYADPVTGEGMVSYVAPLRRADGVIWGVVIAGSFLDSRGDAQHQVEPDSDEPDEPEPPEQPAQQPKRDVRADLLLAQQLQHDSELRVLSSDELRQQAKELQRAVQQQREISATDDEGGERPYLPWVAAA